MNPRPRYVAGKLATLPAVNAQAVGSLAQADWLQAGSYQWPVKELATTVQSSFDSRWLRSVIRAATNGRRTPKLDTPRNRLARQLCNQLESSVKWKNQYGGLLKRLLIYAPLSKETLKLWSRALADHVLLIDPKFERFPELKAITLGAYSTGDKRSKLQKYFHPVFKQLAA